MTSSDLASESTALPIKQDKALTMASAITHQDGQQQQSINGHGDHTPNPISGVFAKYQFGIFTEWGSLLSYFKTLKNKNLNGASNDNFREAKGL